MAKRFIAGAKCPQCGQVDKIYIRQQQGEDLRCCVACDFEEARPREVPTQNEAEKMRPVKLINPK